MPIDEDEAPPTCEVCGQVEGDCTCVECRARWCGRIVEHTCSRCERCDGCCECVWCNCCEEPVESTCGDCESCQRCCSCEASVHSCTYRPTPIFHGAGPRYYGVELEVNGSRGASEQVTSRMGEDHVYCKADGSLSSGFEIVTHPHSFKAQRELWEGYFKAPVRELRSYESGECGCHVHITRAALTEAQIRRMVVFLNAPENLGFVTLVGQRRGNGYCAFKVWKSKVGAAGYSDDRYEALNLTNDKTVEVRIFRGSYRLDRVLKNLDFCDALVEYTATCGYQDLTVAKFYAWLSVRRKTYKYLWSYLTERGFRLTVEPPPPSVEVGEEKECV